MDDAQAYAVRANKIAIIGIIVAFIIPIIGIVLGMTAEERIRKLVAATDQEQAFINRTIFRARLGIGIGAGLILLAIGLALYTR